MGTYDVRSEKMNIKDLVWVERNERLEIDFMGKGVERYRDSV